mmetsp:Transcript_19960/g.32898  ORF Transcript_19960/g.32898 Transcript_19960/m.32898 type:complete len:329 (-) Transcript_19960:1007-1993(-)
MLWFLVLLGVAVGLLGVVFLTRGARSDMRKGPQVHSKLERIYQFVDVVDRFITSGFDKVLQLEFKSMQLVGWCEKEGLQCLYKVPGNVCDGTGALPLGVVASLFDSVSTYAIIAEDKQRRPGVSVSLRADYTQLEARPREGDTLIVAARAYKIGKLMGFAQCSVRRKDSDEVIATGEHIKYLPMGMIWNIAFGRWLFPLVQHASRVFWTQVAPKEQGDNKSKLHDAVSFDEISPCGQKALFQASHIHNNPMGFVHGGCQAILCEKMGLSARKALYNDNNLVVRSLNLSYSSAGRNKLSINVKTMEDGSDVCIQKPNGDVVASARLVFF